MSRQLTLRQARFVAAYIGEANGNAVRAARLAGFRWPEKQAWELLGKPRIVGAIEEHRAAIRAEGIANRQNRVDAQNARWAALQTIVVERAEEAGGERPGGGRGTGFLVKQYKQVGQGPAAQLVEEWAVDKALLSEFRELEEHTARELGQWVEKHDQRHSGAIDVTALSDDQLTILVEGGVLADDAGGG